MSPLDGLRTWVGDQIRERVVGDQPPIEASGRGWFSDHAAIRIVHSDAAMFVGGLRALLLQSLHPLAMAGVAEHSDYRSDPWGRLQRTASFLAATTFGNVHQAEQAVTIVRRVHERVTGTAADGRGYSANDPHLLRWVHIAEIDSFLAAHRRHGANALDRHGYDRYVAEAAVVADALGAESPPRSVDELRRQLGDMRSELSSTPEARDAARYLLLQPPLPVAARAPYAVLAAAAVALMPAWARWPLRLPLLPVTERLVVRQAGTAITQLIRWAVPATPTAPTAPTDPCARNCAATERDVAF
jgi:uncharacterized protein (DUF2236 family)